MFSGVRTVSKFRKTKPGRRWKGGGHLLWGDNLSKGGAEPFKAGLSRRLQTGVNLLMMFSKLPTNVQERVYLNSYTSNVSVFVTYTTYENVQ